VMNFMLISHHQRDEFLGVRCIEFIREE
jgi:hypothetical protein